MHSCHIFPEQQLNICLAVFCCDCKEAVYHILGKGHQFLWRREYSLAFLSYSWLLIIKRLHPKDVPRKQLQQGHSGSCWKGGRLIAGKVRHPFSSWRPDDAACEWCSGWCGVCSWSMILTGGGMDAQYWGWQTCEGAIERQHVPLACLSAGYSLQQQWMHKNWASPLDKVKKVELSFRHLDWFQLLLLL